MCSLFSHSCLLVSFDLCVGACDLGVDLRVNASGGHERSERRIAGEALIEDAQVSPVAVFTVCPRFRVRVITNAGLDLRGLDLCTQISRCKTSVMKNYEH